MTHELKCWPMFFVAVELNIKTFEVRKDDRNFTVGDRLHLREWATGTGYTGKECWKLVVYILDHSGHEGVTPGYVIMSLK